LKRTKFKTGLQNFFILTEIPSQPILLNINVQGSLPLSLICFIVSVNFVEDNNLQI